MRILLLYLVAFCGAHVLGAASGHGATLLMNATTVHDYTKRSISGLVFGGAAAASSRGLLHIMGLEFSLPFLAVLSASFLCLAAINYGTVKIAIRKHSANRTASMNLKSLGKHRLAQDLAATISALGSALFVYSRLPK